MTDTQRLKTVRSELTSRSYDVDNRSDAAIAVPTDRTDRIGVPGRLSVVAGRPDPTALLEVIGDAVAAGRTALLVAHPKDATAIREILTDPPGLAGRTERGRTFYNTPDRLPAGTAGLACCRADDPPTWRAEPADGVTGEGMRFVLYADGEATAAFGTFDDLSCPSADAFEYAYRRADDGRFRVRKLSTDRVVGRFPSVRELKANAYRPVPAPLVPGTVVDGHLPEAWALATVEDGRVTRIEGA
ncbi:hypothetical protein [Natronomonas sp.]|jgi:hypothetical protein|uniref:hypothetical protein n=1 Tax=Natronomonas sp. TaxID=2184060 RepID=UPI003989EF37